MKTPRFPLSFLPRFILLPLLFATAGLVTLTGCELDGESLRSDLETRALSETDTAGTPTPAPTPVASNPAPGTGALPPAGSSNTFLWKPVSESNGNLVVLLPAAYRGRVQSCTISGSFGSEVGRFHTDTHNGNRPHFRFSRPGAAYGSNITVLALSNGDSIDSWIVPNGSSRYEENL